MIKELIKGNDGLVRAPNIRKVAGTVGLIEQ